MRTFSILGDSYSTYAGWNPEGYAPWYAPEGNAAPNDVRCVEDTWWYGLGDWKLLCNSSYGGSTVCDTGYNGEDSSAYSFVTRMKRDFGQDCEEPDILLIFGGTNDHWAGSPVGDLRFSGWTSEDLKAFAPAFCYMLDYLTQRFPRTRIYNLQNDWIFDPVMCCRITEGCAHYRVKNILLSGIEKQNGHPNRTGMMEIRKQVGQAILMGN